MRQTLPDEWNVRLQTYLREHSSRKPAGTQSERPFQFGLRSLFGLLTASACLVALWIAADPAIRVVLLFFGVFLLVTMVLAIVLAVPYVTILGWLRIGGGLKAMILAIRRRVNR